MLDITTNTTAFCGNSVVASISPFSIIGFLVRPGDPRLGYRGTCWIEPWIDEPCDGPAFGAVPPTATHEQCRKMAARLGITEALVLAFRDPTDTERSFTGVWS